MGADAGSGAAWKSWRTPRIPRADAPRVPQGRERLGRRAQPAELPEADGRVAGAGGLSTAGRLRQAAGEKIVPYVQQPEQVIPGRPLFFATAMVMNGFGNGVLVEQPRGPADQGRGQPRPPREPGRVERLDAGVDPAALRPDRSQTVMRAGLANSWGTFLNQLQDLLQFDLVHAKRAAASCGNPAPRRRALRMLTETVTSPTLADQIGALQTALPGTRWHVVRPGQPRQRAGRARLAFGRELTPVYRFDRAKVILSLDSNFLMDDPGSVRYARDFARSRGVDGIRRPIDAGEMSRLYAVESTPTITGTKADHRLRLPPDEVQTIARQIARAIGGQGEASAASETPATGRTTHPAERAAAGAEERKRRSSRPSPPTCGEPARRPRRRRRMPAAGDPRAGLRDEPGAGQHRRRQAGQLHQAARGRRPTGVESLRNLLAAIDAGRSICC